MASEEIFLVIKEKSGKPNQGSYFVMVEQMGPKFSCITDKSALEEGEVFAPKFDRDGLIPAIVTDNNSGEVLMFAWMNEQALATTLETSRAHFWSRSRQKFWMKGEESGNVLRVLEIRTDCDQDVLWLRVEVEGEGVACHTKRVSCFYRKVSVMRPDVTNSKLCFLEKS